MNAVEAVFAHRKGEIKVEDTMVMRCFDMLRHLPKPEDCWDMNLEQPQWILDAHNTCQGRIFMFGTGPSLVSQSHLLPLMEHEATWTVNRMAQWDLPFTPLFHGVAEPAPIIGWGGQVNPTYDYPKVKNRIAVNWWKVTAPGWRWVAKAPDDVQVRWHGVFGLGDTLPPIPTAWASPLTLTQVALWLGFTQIYILGCDTTQQGQAWDVDKGRTTEPRNIRSIVECADRMKFEIWKAGREIWDCTPGGRLNEEGALPYKSLEEVLDAG